MTPAREVALIIERELGRNLRSAKGIILAILCVLGGVGSALVVNAGKEAAYRRFTEEAAREARAAGYAELYGKEIGKYLADAPEVLFIMLMTTIALAPFLAALLGFDSVSSDLQHRSVRYWTVRSRRSSYFIGKYLGIFATASLMTLVMQISICIALVTKSDVPLTTAISWSMRFWLTTLPISAAWCALAAFMSSLLKTPILALLLSFVGWLVFGLVYVIARIGEKKNEVPPLAWIYPNGYDRLLLSPSPDTLAIGVGASLAFAAVFLVAAAFIFQKRDL